MTNVDNNQDILDGRDVQYRLDELVEKRNEYQDEHCLDEYPGFENSLEESKWCEWDDSEEGWELGKLETFVDDYWTDIGDATSIIRDSYFDEYAENFAYDIGEVDSRSNITHYIKWEDYAWDMRRDYSELTFDGVTYWAK